MKIFYLLIPASLYLSHSVVAEPVSDHLPEEHTPLEIAQDLTLQEVVEKTYQHNPLLQVLESRRRHNQSLAESASSSWAADPAFTIRHQNDLIMDNDGLQEWEVGMEFPLWMPGQRDARQNTASMDLSSINTSGPALKLQLAGIVREILWNIALTENSLSIAEHEWMVVQKLERDVKKRVELGDLAQSDLILTQQETLSREAAWYLARQEHLHAQHRYEMVTGLKTLPAVFDEKAHESITIDLDHPTLKQAQENANHSMALLEQSILEKRDNPVLLLGTRHERGTSDEEFADSFGFSFRMPLGLAAHSNPKITMAEVDLADKQSQLETLHRELNMKLHDSHRELLATIEQYDYSKRQYELSQRTLSMSRKAFSLGENSLIELIRIQAQAFAAERNMHQKQLEVGLQTARLNQAKGIIP